MGVDQVELGIQEIIEQDCARFVVNKRRRAVRGALRRYKEGKSGPGERAILLRAMRTYKEMAKGKGQVRTYNVLLHFYFADTPLTTEQMPVRFNVNKRTIFKDITRGVEDLTVLIFGIGGVVLQSDDEGSAAFKARLQSSLYKELSGYLKGGS